jgi:hypothetical protein
MEDVIFSYSGHFPVKTARFANVAFSNGSLPAGFMNRISKRQPLSAPLDVKRYFVSPKESGQICMLSCMLGENREIFFPKLEERQMMTFDAIAAGLLREYGYEAVRCGSEEEAVEMAGDLNAGSMKYPVYYSESDTSGEKMFEEFYTENELVDMERFYSLGVITGKRAADADKINALFLSLEAAFASDAVTKERIIAIIRAYLPNFEHIETGRSLDGKM